MESCSSIKDGNRRLAIGEEEVKRVWKDYPEVLYNTDTHEALRGFLDITTRNSVSNERISVLCGEMKGEDERFDGSFLQWFGSIKRMRNDRIGKMVYVGESW